jgi:hypothetical protein
MKTTQARYRHRAQQTDLMGGTRQQILLNKVGWKARRHPPWARALS